MSNAQTQLKVIHRQELTKVGKKTVSSFGFRNDLAEEHLRWHLTQMSNKWCSIDCMARLMFGRASPQNRMGIRKRIRNTFRVLLDRGVFLVIEYDNSTNGHGKIKAIKLFEIGVGGAEGEYAVHQINKMAQRMQITDEMRVKALAAIGCQDHAQETA
jgi:hypothetical protein